MTSDRLPNFLLVGAPKCGTSTIAHHLGAHPDIFFSRPKEPMFLASDVVEAARLQNSDSPGMRVHSLTEYKALFSKAGAAQMCGEGSVYYLYLWRWVIPKIKSILGDPHIIISVRNPVQRLFSHYLYNYIGIERPPPFENFLNKCTGYIERELGENRFVFQGRYAEQIRAYQQHFTHVHIVVFEDFRDEVAITMKEIYNFLGVDDTFEPNCAVRILRRGVPRLPFLQKPARNAFVSLQPIMSRYLGQRSISKLRAKLASWSYSNPQLSAPMGRRLLELYEPEIRSMEVLLNRPLPSWRTIK